MPPSYLFNKKLRSPNPSLTFLLNPLEIIIFPLCIVFVSVFFLHHSLHNDTCTTIFDHLTTKSFISLSTPNIIVYNAIVQMKGVLRKIQLLTEITITFEYFLMSSAKRPARVFISKEVDSRSISPPPRAPLRSSSLLISSRSRSSTSGARRSKTVIIHLNIVE